MSSGGSSSTKSSSLVDMRTAIQEFQAFAGLNITGTLDAETMELMNTPRCGVKDDMGFSNAKRRRRKRYVLQGI